MKFAQQLEYNAYTPWKPYYLSYTQLKDLLRALRNPLFYSSAPSANTEEQEHAISLGGGDVEEGMEERRRGAGDSSDEERGREGGDAGFIGGGGRRLQRSGRGGLGRGGGMRRVASKAALVSTGLDRSASSRVLKDMGGDGKEKEEVEEEVGDEDMEAVGLLEAEGGAGVYGAAGRQKGGRRKGVRWGGAGRLSSAPLSFEEGERRFFLRLEQEAKKVDAFFKRMVEELKTRVDTLYRYARLVKFVYTRCRTNTPVRAEELSEEDMVFYKTLEGYDASMLFELVHALDDKYIETYKEVDELINFGELNGTGFDKILKKHDKVTGMKTRSEFMEKLNRTRSFTSPKVVENMRTKLIGDYTVLFCNNNGYEALRKFQGSTRELVVWEHNTIWREMLREERKIRALRPKGKDTFGDSVKVHAVIFALFAFLIIYFFPRTFTFLVLPKNSYSKAMIDAAHRCFAMLISVCILWASGGLELFVTSLLIIPASVLLGCFLDSSGNPLNPHDAALQVFAAMGSSTLMLIVSVYATHAALSKYEVDKVIATKILARVRQPDGVLLVLMVLAVILSMFVSNVATPVLLNSVVLPVFHSLPTSARPLVRCMLLGIAIASNVGGMASTIASPQNAVAVGLLSSLHEIGFVWWLVAALPQCAIILMIAHRLLLIKYRPSNYELQPVQEHKVTFKWQHYTIIFTMIITIVLWSLPSSGKMFGSQGLIAMLPVIVFFGSGLLRKEDFDNLPWHVIYLVAGGIALGAAVQSSHLLSIIADYLMSHLTNASVWMTYFVFVLFVAIVASAVSHTVSAIIVLPIVAEVGAGLGHPRLLVMGCTLACSGAMCLPVSSFPNISAVSIRDELGSPYLEVGELIRVGIVMTVVSVTVILTSGYFLMSFIGF